MEGGGTVPALPLVSFLVSTPRSWFTHWLESSLNSILQACGLCLGPGKGSVRAVPAPSAEVTDPGGLCSAAPALGTTGLVSCGNSKTLEASPGAGVGPGGEHAPRGEAEAWRVEGTGSTGLPRRPVPQCHAPDAGPGPHPSLPGTGPCSQAAQKQEVDKRSLSSKLLRLCLKISHDSPIMS